MENSKLIVGLETHIELSTTQKMFCGCSAEYFGKTPNTQTCPVCLGLPGALPVPNIEAVRLTIMLGMACNCSINTYTFFERKNYFYPDLPKGYQISQYLKPFCYDGHLEVNGHHIRIRRIHLEEDTGKLLHGEQLNEPGTSYIDFNRSGVPLVEVVTEPDITSSEIAVEYLKKLQRMVQYLGASDCDMEKGSMRCEPNISLQRNTKLSPYKVEVKNINSFRFVKNAIDYEQKRQALIIEKGELPEQETRRYVESNGKTASMRTKEEAHDYRYFPEPDIPPIELTAEMLEDIKKELNSKELPDKRLKRLIKEYKLRKDTTEFFVENKTLGDLFLSLKHTNLNSQKLAVYLINERKKLTSYTPSEILKSFKEKTATVTIDESVIQKAVQEALVHNQSAAADYKKGKENALQFLLGAALRIIGKRVEAHHVLSELKKQLSGTT